jgi:uncharacterized protein YlxP (DUF503 family)
VTVHVLALTVELHLPQCRSLKEKRAVLKPVLEGARRRYSVASSETDHQDTWQRAQLAFVCVSGSTSHASDVIDEVERFVWSFTESDVVDVRRDWLEVD